MTLPLEESPRTAGLGVSHVQFYEDGKLQADRVAVVLMKLEECAFDEIVERVTDHVFVEGEGLEGFLVEKV